MNRHTVMNLIFRQVEFAVDGKDVDIVAGIAQESRLPAVPAVGSLKAFECSADAIGDSQRAIGDQSTLTRWFGVADNLPILVGRRAGNSAIPRGFTDRFAKRLRTGQRTTIVLRPGVSPVLITLSMSG